MPYMATFTINIPQMLAYIPYMDPMGNCQTSNPNFIGTSMEVSWGHGGIPIAGWFLNGKVPNGWLGVALFDVGGPFRVDYHLLKCWFSMAICMFTRGYLILSDCIWMRLVPTCSNLFVSENCTLFFCGDDYIWWCCPAGHDFLSMCC